MGVPLSMYRMRLECSDQKPLLTPVASHVLLRQEPEEEDEDDEGDDNQDDDHDDEEDEDGYSE